MTMQTQYIPSLVVLSVGVAIFASYVALNLAYSVTQSKGKAQLGWLIGGALAMGVGIWSMHFVGMLAFEMPGMDMAYDVPLMVLSVVVAIFASALALYIVSRPKATLVSLVLGGVAMAAAIAGMHYIGMFSMRMEARIEWNVYLVLLSIAIALVASFAALMICIQLRDKAEKQRLLFFASALMGVAISGMHYTGMFAATFIHDPSAIIHVDNLLVTSGLSVSVIATTLLILGIALMGSIGQRVMSLRNRRNEEILVTNEIRFRHLIEAVKDYAIFMLDTKGFITTWNSGAERITGYKEEEVLGKHFHMLYPVEHRAALKEKNELQIARNKGRFEVEDVHLKKDGSIFWANVVISPVFERDGRIKGFSKVTRDITQMREAAQKLHMLNEELEARVRERTLELEQREAELKAAKEAAEVANATKSAFLANMSHEIRTPLGAIIGFSELMLDETMTAAEKQKNIEIIKRNGKLLSGIINDILDLSKVEAAKLEVEKSDVRIVDLVNDVVSLLSLEAKEKGIKVQVSSEGPAPSVAKTDPLRLRQILFNIIGNAVKFTEKGSVNIKVKLVEEASAQLAFIVQDSGAGISSEQRQRLFSPFTQADVTTTRKFGGTGLGLVLSKKLAQALGGDVVLLSSSLGQGSTFRVTIDHGQSNATEFGLLDWSGKSTTTVSNSEKANELSNLNILLVDDSLDNQELIKRLLQLAGAKVETANNGIEAIEKVNNGSFNIVLMDLQMPEMDGYEATRRLRLQGVTLPIIALTAHAMKEERKKCLESGFDNHLTKPIDRKLLIQTLVAYNEKIKQNSSQTMSV